MVSGLVYSIIFAGLDHRDSLSGAHKLAQSHLTFFRPTAKIELPR